MNGKKSKTVAIIVAHPDDETLWVGGTILSHPSWKCFIVCLCRKSDINRAPKFMKTLKILNSEGVMGDLDDGADQKPLNGMDVKLAILDLLPRKHFDLIITHNPTGEYTKHVRHEEVSKAVIKLWETDEISLNELWTFAYEDGGRKYYPLSVKNASISLILAKKVWLIKYKIITETYGFEKNSFEAETTPKTESFWQFTKQHEANKWLKNGGKNESISSL